MEGGEVKGSLQLPGAVSELGTGLPDVEMENLLKDIPLARLACCLFYLHVELSRLLRVPQFGVSLLTQIILTYLASSHLVYTGC
jgi:hypothetical protein